ncbi:MAG: 50S ribosomal protein L22 [SAR324 cluster bacterium]|nr:50S ribosomal protein L22 [SAR324 cluster bacterium]
MEAKQEVKQTESFLSKASIRNVGIPLSKMKRAGDLLRGKRVDYALGILKNTRRMANISLIDLIKSAIANAVEKDENVKADQLRIKTLITNQGKVLKRMRPRAMGRGNVILKRSCHIYIELF